MKKIISIAITSFLVLITLTACNNQNDNKNKVQQNITDNQTEQMGVENSTSVHDKIVNDDGKEFIVDITVAGEIKETSNSVSSNKVVIN